jgi:predicted outer membrane repeat protein
VGGGAIYVSLLSDLEINDSKFIRNIALLSYGGAIYSTINNII